MKFLKTQNVQCSVKLGLVYTLFCATLLSAGLARADADGKASTGYEVIIPKYNTDLTAQRVDAEVFGFSKDLDEMAAVVVKVNRRADGQIRGDAYTVVWAIGSATPIQNARIHHITQAAVPDDPVPLPSAESLTWAAGHNYQSIWSRLPRSKKQGGFVEVEAIWAKAQVEPSICVPATGLFLRRGKELRYHEFEQVNFKQSCSSLKLGDVRTVWANRDIAAVMMRFDYGPNAYNERSFTYPFSANFKHAETLRVAIATSDPEQYRRWRTKLKNKAHIIKRVDPSQKLPKSLSTKAGWAVLRGVWAEELGLSSQKVEIPKGFNVLIVP